MSTSRREFMKLAAAGAAGVALAEALPASAQVVNAGGKAPKGSVAVRLTAGAKRYAEQPPIQWQPAAGSAGDAIILNPDKTYQDVLGFGAAFTDAACYNFGQLAPDQREQLLHELFSPSEMNFSVCRTCIGSSDYSAKLYSYDEGSEPDPELKRFSIDHDKSYILPSMRLARKINPDLFLLGSPWSPPAWMKTNGSMLGGTLYKHYYAPYAQYFVNYLKAYEAEGVAINAVTSQNEVDTDQDARMPACLFGQEYEIEFVSRYLGPEIAKNDLKTKIWIIDHNYNLWGRAICELDVPELNKYVDGVAWHGYAGTPDAMTRVHDAHPEKNAYWTEGGPDYTDPAYLTDWSKWSTTYAGILRNWSRCIIGWNLALDENGKPNIGPFPCGGVVTINSKTKEITRSGQYWGFAHYSKAVRRGAKRFDSQADIPGVSHVAFANPDGTHAVVLTNTGAERNVSLQMAGVMAELALPKDSVSTLTW
jgi:glucosylceramidase